VGVKPPLTNPDARGALITIPEDFDAAPTQSVVS
jgi:hypothetical protein